MSTALPPSSSTSVDSNKDVSTWRPSQVAQWLRLTERYVFLPYFIAQSVDGAALLKLSDGQVEGSLSLDAVLKLDDIPKPTSTQRRLLIEHVQKLNEAQPQEDQPGWQLVREATRDLLVQKDMPKTLNDWRRTIKTNSVAHDYLTRVYRDRATILTVFVVALNAIVGSAVFSSAGGGGQDSESWQQVLSIAAGALSMLAGVLSAVKSALGWETRAEMHRAAALRYSKLWIRFDDMHGLMKVAYVSSEGDGNVPAKNEGWADWFKDYMEVVEMAPSVPDIVWKKFTLSEEEWRNAWWRGMTCGMSQCCETKENDEKHSGQRKEGGKKVSPELEEDQGTGVGSS